MASISVDQHVQELQDSHIWVYISTGERILAGASLIVLSPLLLILWGAVLALSGRSPLIAHRRVGRYGSELWVLKFRTMWDPASKPLRRKAFSIEHIDDEAGPAMKGPGDLRIPGGFARFCRRHSLDELPQLIHVLSGEMSLVGPRPVTPAELHEIYGTNASVIVRAKPGLSGLWQVSGRNRLTVEERCRLDLQCVRTRSVKLYFEILARTIPEVLAGSSTW